MSDVAAKLQGVQALMHAGRLAEARASLERVLRKAPGSVEANSMMSYILTHAGDGARAKFYAQRALDLRPGDAKLLNNLAGAMLAGGEYDAAILVFERALAAAPTHLSSLAGMATALNGRYRHMEAEAISVRGLETHPGQLHLRMQLAYAYLNTGRAREAVAILQDLARQEPENLQLASGLVYFMNYAGGLDPMEVMRAHQRYGALLARHNPTPLAPGPSPTEPERKLRVGLMSADFRAHAVGFFAEPLLEHHDRERLEIVVYSNTLWEDRVSDRLRTMAAAWRNVMSLGDAELAQTIRRDRIDILMEYSGHSAGHRFGTFQLRAAPVQVTYFGYPNTTGVPAMDYRIVDSVTDPKEARFDSLATEKLVRLDPCFLCYSPMKGGGAPEVAPTPALANGCVTFGSFNNLAKLDDWGVELWVEVLNAIPGSRMFLKHHGLAQSGARELTMRRFTKRGITAERVFLEGPGAGAAEMLGAYARMDVMLDSFPYHGTTTTCEALYMGVPVVALTGEWCAARVSTSIVTAAGHPEFAAGSREEFVKIAAGLVGDVNRLAGIRSRLRDEMLGSPVCDGPGYARRFEGAFREMWREACRKAGAK